MIWHALTAVLVVLKLMEIITVSWWIVLAPTLIAFGLFLFMVVFAVAIAALSKD